VPYFKKLLQDGACELPVTHSEMTRFWITLQQGVDFVLKNFERMQGGEIFVPKIPSMRVRDLAESMQRGIPIRIIGIRPGEKLHEVMCPADDSHLTLEFNDHYVIRPSIKYHDRDLDFTCNAIGETGELVPQGFVYDSGSNHHFLTVEELAEMNDSPA
jgi:UDP-N-acetylglucosamine 4,6-dehydratase